MTTVEAWAVAGTVATIIYTFLTFRLLMQNKKINETNNKLAEFQIYNEIAKQLNDKRVKETLKSIFNDENILFDKEHLCYDIFNPLEDLAKFNEDGLISIKSVNSGYGYMILKLFNNKNVIKVLAEERKAHDNLYDGIITLYSKVYVTCNTSEQKKFSKTIVFPKTE